MRIPKRPFILEQSLIVESESRIWLRAFREKGLYLGNVKLKGCDN